MLGAVCSTPTRICAVPFNPGRKLERSIIVLDPSIARNEDRQDAACAELASLDRET
jgi:hypothetical protein